MNNLETLMAELVRASVGLKRFLYLQDAEASSTPEGADGPLTTIHLCRVCGKAAAGKEAQVHHEPNCGLARLQRAQAALRGACPELFAWSKPAAGAPPSTAPQDAAPPVASGAQARMGRRAVVPAAIENDQPPASSAPPEPQAARRKVRQSRAAQLGAVHRGTPVPAAPVYVPPSQVRRTLGDLPAEQRNA